MKNKASPNQLKNGDVLIDNLSFLQARPLLDSDRGNANQNIRQAATLLESLVLYDRLIVDPLIRDSSSSHHDEVKMVIDTVPDDIVAYLDIPITRKLRLFDSIVATFPSKGFNWEWFLNRVGPSHDAETFWISDNVREIWNRLPPEQKPNSLSYFRRSGFIGKQVYYLSLSNLVQIPYVPNYERNIIYKAIFVAHNNPKLAKEITSSDLEKMPLDVPTVQEAVLTYFEEQVIKPVDNLLSSVLSWQSVTSPMPPLLSRIDSIARKKGCSAIEAALDIRKSSEASAFREWCRKISEAHKANNRKALIRLIKGFVQECESWCKNFGDDEVGGQISINLFGIGIQRNTADPVASIRRKLMKHLVFLRELI